MAKFHNFIHSVSILQYPVSDILAQSSVSFPNFRKKLPGMAKYSGKIDCAFVSPY